MDISIIITYYSGLNIIQNCLYSLYDSLKTTKYSYEIIVVNDNPNIKLENYLQDFSSLKILNHEINMDILQHVIMVPKSQLDKI